MSQLEVVATGVRFGEGPTWRSQARDLVVVSVLDGVVWRIDPGTGTIEIFADTGGGPNGTAPCDDGGVVIAQNGGIDFAALGGRIGRQLVVDPPVPRFVAPGVQRVTPDGRVVSLSGDWGPFLAPNDLVVGPDGAVYFTDPPHMPPPPGREGRVWRMGHAEGGGGMLRVDLLAGGFVYCNGLGFEPDGTLVVVEANGLQRLHADGDREWIVEDLGGGGGDGFALDTEGRFYVCGRDAGVVRVIDAAGAVVEEFAGPDGAFLTNCCFGGDDLRTLFVMDAGGDSVVALEGLPSSGLPVRAWVGPAA